MSTKPVAPELGAAVRMVRYREILRLTAMGTGMCNVAFWSGYNEWGKQTRD